MKKKDVITIILTVLFVALLVSGIILIVKDMELSHIVAAEANSTQQKILEIPETDPDYNAKREALQNAFEAFLAGKTPVQTAFTITSLVSIAASITCLVFAIKRVARDISDKSKEKQKE